MAYSRLFLSTDHNDTMVARKYLADNGTNSRSPSTEEEDVEDGINGIGGDSETIPLTPAKAVHGLELTQEDARDASEHDSKVLAPKVLLVLAFQVGNIMLWYWTNGMNGIAMQSYAELVHDPTRLTSASLRFLSTLALTGIVTCLQLMLGALIGRVFLYFLNSSIHWEHITSTHSPPLSGLHALGSMATNLGFMYGKASLVQVIKLLEPFETLVLSQILFREAKCSLGIFSAITMVIGAAMSLLTLQSTPPHPLSIFSAILSGLTLSCRNVLQRKHHSQPHQATGREHDTTTKDPSSLQQQPPPQPWSKLEKSVIQFTQLSFFSGLWTGACAIFLYMLVQPYVVPWNYQVLLWHPLYNIFSMITLGFCSALTHSLLNAGKRVFAICMAMLWFREGLSNPATLAGLALVAIGGSWYSLETKRKDTPSKPEYDKLLRCGVGLGVLVSFQSMFQ